LNQVSDDKWTTSSPTSIHEKTSEGSVYLGHPEADSRSGDHGVGKMRSNLVSMEMYVKRLKKSIHDRRAPNPKPIPYLMHMHIIQMVGP